MMTIYIFVLLANLKSDGGGICNRLGGNLRGLSIGNTAELVYLLGKRDVERIYFMVKYFYYDYILTMQKTLIVTTFHKY